MVSCENVHVVHAIPLQFWVHTTPFAILSMLFRATKFSFQWLVKFTNRSHIDLVQAAKGEVETIKSYNCSNLQITYIQQAEGQKDNNLWKQTYAIFEIHCNVKSEYISSENYILKPRD